VATHGAGGEGLPAVDDNRLLDDTTRLASGVLERSHDSQPLTLRRDRRARRSRTAQECIEDFGVISTASTPARTAGTRTGPAAASAATTSAATSAAAASASALAPTSGAATTTASTTALASGIDLFHRPTIVIGGGEGRNAKQHHGSCRHEDPVAKRVHGQTPVERLVNIA
jgi:hypothetical protein